MQIDFTYPKERNEISNCDADLKNDKDEFMNNNEDEKIEIEKNRMLNEAKKDTNNTLSKIRENQVKGKIQEITRGNKKLNKNSYLKEGFQSFTETLDFEIHERGNYQISLESQINFKILGEGNFQTSLENFQLYLLYFPTLKSLEEEISKPFLQI